MADIMDEFAVALDAFDESSGKAGWEVEFNSAQYPPSIVMRQIIPPLYRVTDEGREDITHRAQIKVLGLPETEVVTSGNLQLSKKELNKMVNSAAQLLELYLHGFMQDAKAAEMDG